MIIFTLLKKSRLCSANSFLSKIKYMQRHHIKYMCVLKKSDRTAQLDISLITDDLQYVEFDFSFNLRVMTSTLAQRIRSLFVDFQFDKDTQIVVSPRLVDPSNPFYMYLLFLHQQILFNIRKVTEDQIVRRIATYHKSYIKSNVKINKRHFNQMWSKLVEMDKCPWISKQIEYDLQMKSLDYAKRKRRCRMTLYYMVIREYLMTIKRRSEQRSNKIQKV